MRTFSHALALSAILASPAYANTVPGGQASLSYETSDASAPGFTGETDSFRLDGAYALPLGGNFGLQLDVAALRVTDKGFPGQSEILAGGANLFYRTSGFSIGAFAGFAHIDVSTGGKVRQYGGGVEANAYAGPVSVGAVYGIAESDDAFDVRFEGWDLSARWFPTANLMLRAKAGFFDGEENGSRFAVRTRGGSVEYRLPSSPFSLYAGATRFRIAAFNFTETSLYVGLRYNFGTATLRQRDRQGASMATFTDMFTGR